MIIEGARKDGNEGIFAIDDTGLKVDPCPPPGSCDFEGGTCGWKTDTNGLVSWEWITAEDSLNHLYEDHTTQTGLGMF